MEEKIYSCPMHPAVKEEQPGHCPDCGMNLVPEKKRKIAEDKHGNHSHDKHAGHSLDMFTKRFWFSLVLTIPVLVYSELFLRLSKWQAPAFPGSEYLTIVLSSIVFFYGGWIFILGAYRELRGRSPGMMTLIALAIATAYLYSVYSKISGQDHDLFWELTTLITIMLLGHWLEMRAVQGAQGALKELSKLLPDTAEVIRDGQSKNIPLRELKLEDIIFVRPGGKIPADGVVIEGKSEVNESMITGESKPVLKIINNEVIGGTINGDGALKIKITKIGESTFLAGVMRLIKEAQASKSKLQILSDKAAFYLTIVAVGVGILTFFVWFFVSKSSFSFALERLVAVLVVACPHALGLAIPLVASISTTMAARRGFLVRQRLALEAARNVDVVLFDKTGTLTTGEYGVVSIINNFESGITGEDLLMYASSVDSHSEHFVARAIVKDAASRGVSIQDVQNFERLPGLGVTGIVDGKKVFVGGENLLKNLNIVLSGPIKGETDELAKTGKTIIFVVVDGQLLGALGLTDLIREESRRAIYDLKNMGVRVAMITGDSDDVAGWVAKELGIDEYFSRVLPGEKVEKVKLLQDKKLKVAMVGDGINDAPALTQANVGIAIGAGTNVAIESAGIVLVRNDPRDISKIIKLSRLTYNKMLQNLFWATGYNVVALPLAAGVLATWGIFLEPAVAAIFMSFSTVIVAINAVLLRRSNI